MAPLPPLGWSSWNSLGGGITEALIRAQADAMVASGMRKAGYTYINIDDMWAEAERDPTTGKFQNGLPSPWQCPSI